MGSSAFSPSHPKPAGPVVGQLACQSAEPGWMGKLLGGLEQFRKGRRGPLGNLKGSAEVWVAPHLILGPKKIYFVFDRINAVGF